MNFQLNVCRWLVAAALAGVLACQGCTIHFKAQEMEFEMDKNQTYHLERIDLFGGEADKS